jgi:23S rRNA (pseudouridine1915-N3)-methyltransferase
MNIRIICIGKLKEKYWKDAEAEYLKRLGAYANVSVTELKESRSDDIDEEGESILQALGSVSGKAGRGGAAGKGPHEYVITLEIKGKSLTSEGLAEKMAGLALDGKSDISFVIGGSNGLSKAVSDRADFKLSFSAMTFPHQMMRVILLEQIYRSFKINRNEKYHK